MLKIKLPWIKDPHVFLSEPYPLFLKILEGSWGRRCNFTLIISGDFTDKKDNSKINFFFGSHQFNIWVKPISESTIFENKIVSVCGMVV